MFPSESSHTHKQPAADGGSDTEEEVMDLVSMSSYAPTVSSKKQGPGGKQMDIKTLLKQAGLDNIKQNSEQLPKIMTMQLMEDDSNDFGKYDK